MNNDNDTFEERRKYVTAFNRTMVKIWKEQISLLGVVDTGALYRSTLAVGMTADGKFTQITLSQCSEPTVYFRTTAQGVRLRAAIRATSAATRCANAAAGSLANTSPR